MEVRNNFWLLTGTPFSGSCISLTRLSICHQQQVIGLKGKIVCFVFFCFCFCFFFVLTIVEKKCHNWMMDGGKEENGCRGRRCEKPQATIASTMVGAGQEHQLLPLVDCGRNLENVISPENSIETSNKSPFDSIPSAQE